jgi:hypothetical protein
MNRRVISFLIFEFILLSSTKIFCASKEHYFGKIREINANLITVSLFPYKNRKIDWSTEIVGEFERSILESAEIKIKPGQPFDYYDLSRGVKDATSSSYKFSPRKPKPLTAAKCRAIMKRIDREFPKGEI